MNLEIAKILDADIATAIWAEKSFSLADFGLNSRIFLTEKNFKKWMIGFLKMKWNFYKFGKNFSEKNKEKNSNFQNYSRFFLSNEASSVVWQLPRDSEKIFYAHSISRHLFDLYDEYLAKVPFFAKIPYRIMAYFLRKIYIVELSKFDIILTNSEANKLRLKEYCGVDSIVLFPPVNTEKFSPIIWEKNYDFFKKYKNHEKFLQKIEEKNTWFFLSFSRVNATKWVDKIIESFKKLKDKNILIIFGSDDSDREDFQKISGISPSKNQDEILQSEKFANIFWLSISKNSELPEIIKRAKMTVCMSKNEDFGMVAIESMAVGIPVIAPDEWGYKTTILREKTGFLIQENSVECLVENLAKIPESFYEETKGDCINRAKEFSLNKMQEKLAKILENRDK